MNINNLPGFSAEKSLTARSNRHRTRPQSREIEMMNEIIPAVPMPYCKTVCKWRVCGSALPGYPPPMCYSCEQECWIHDTGPYSRSFSM
jgi:hypothetical protein